MRFERLMALRYLRGAQGQSEGRKFLRFITYVAVGGVALGVAALLLSLSIVRGFSREIEAKIIGFGAHIQVESYQDEPLQNISELREQLHEFDQIQGIAPVVQEFVLLRRSATEIDGVLLWGTDSLPSFLEQSLIAGSAALNADTSGHSGIVIGEDLAGLMGVQVGEVVTAFSVRARGDDGAGGGMAAQRPRVAQFRVSGIYETSLQDFDELYVFVDITEARDLLRYNAEEATRLDLTLFDINQAEPVARAVEKELGFPILARTIYEVWRGLFAWVNLQESIIPLVIGVIIIVAAFNIVGALLMIILEKAREIGILESMGASPRVLRRLFLWLGLLIGSTGTAIGIAVALILAVLQQRYRIIPLPEEAYYMKWAPVELNALDFVTVAVVAIILCAVASYVPARVASRIDPIRVIRFR